MSNNCGSFSTQPLSSSPPVRSNRLERQVEFHLLPYLSRHRLFLSLAVELSIHRTLLPPNTSPKSRFLIQQSLLHLLQVVFFRADFCLTPFCRSFSHLHVKPEFFDWLAGPPHIIPQSFQIGKTAALIRLPTQTPQRNLMVSRLQFRPHEMPPELSRHNRHSAGSHVRVKNHLTLIRCR